MLARPVHRWLLLALVLVGTAFSAAARADDTLIGADGMRTGTVEGYAAGICRFEGADVPRASIYYIGLDAELPPPQPQDPMRDEVHLRDGSVHPGPLVSIDADKVVTESSSLARRDVTWIWLTPLTSLPPGTGQGTGVAPPATTETDRHPTYAWDGTIRIENRANSAEYGWHDWRATYRIRLLEVDNRFAFAGPPDGPRVPIKDLEPQQIDYEIQADQNWISDLGGTMGVRTVTMTGTARGKLTGDDFAGYRYLRGNMTAIETPLSAPYRPPHAFASYIPELSDHYYGAQDKAFNAGEPGWYFLEMRFREETYARARALYRGIERGGSLPISYTDPDQDFTVHIPNWMPDITYIAGRLESPEQAEVSGEFTLDFEFREDGSVQKIKVEWSFTRTRQ
ncbi:MAG: hypothetical protein AB7E71_23365 [Dongiaceae bacterium]